MRAAVRPPPQRIAYVALNSPRYRRVGVPLDGGESARPWQWGAFARRFDAPSRRCTWNTGPDSLPAGLVNVGTLGRDLDFGELLEILCDFRLLAGNFVR
jgi:hypothetical protein